MLTMPALSQSSIDVGIVLSPLAVALTVMSRDMPARHLLISVAFAIVAVAPMAAAALSRPGWRRPVALAVLAFYLAGNAVNAQTLYRHGRGGYLEGFQYLQCKPVRVFIITAIECRLPATCLRYWHFHLTPGLFKQLNRGKTDRGPIKIDQAGYE